MFFFSVFIITNILCCMQEVYIFGTKALQCCAEASIVQGKTPFVFHWLDIYHLLKKDIFLYYFENLEMCISHPIVMFKIEDIKLLLNDVDEP